MYLWQVSGINIAIYIYFLKIKIFEILLPTSGSFCLITSLNTSPFFVQFWRLVICLLDRLLSFFPYIIRLSVCIISSIPKWFMPSLLFSTHQIIYSKLFMVCVTRGTAVILEPCLSVCLFDHRYFSQLLDSLEY